MAATVVMIAVTGIDGGRHRWADERRNPGAGGSSGLLEFGPCAVDGAGN